MWAMMEKFLQERVVGRLGMILRGEIDMPYNVARKQGGINGLLHG